MKCNTRQRLLEIFVILMLMPIFLVSTSAEHGEQGDVNGDGIVDYYDAQALRNYLVGNAGGIHAVNADMNSNDIVDLKDIILLERYIGDGSCDDPDESDVIVRSIVYGRSEMDRDLVCTILEPHQYSRTILAVFAIHGFEDWYDHDGQKLVDTAQMIIEHFQDAETLADSRLMVIAPANPDGLNDGTSHNGFGRCNANGVDLNRDFDAAHVAMSNARNYTPYPFSAAESRALRDLVDLYKPDIVLDCHGWENCTIGDSELAAIFSAQMGLIHRTVFSDNAHGYFSYWAHQQGALALLVEFSNPDFDPRGFIDAMSCLTQGNYDDETGIYELDSSFANIDNVKTYALSTDNVTTYLDFEGNQTGYIYGREDLCVIEKFYKNGYVRVTYPVSSGNKTAYCPLSAFIAPNERVDIAPISFSTNQIVYRRSDLSQSIGSVYTTDVSYQIAATHEAIQIIYPLDTGGWKMGWVPVSSVNSLRLKATAQVSEDRLEAMPILVETEQDFDVAISVQAKDLIALRLWLIYDASIMTLERTENGDCLEKMTLNDNCFIGQYCMLWADSLEYNPRSVSGTLATLRFSIAEGVSPQDAAIQVILVPENAVGSALNEVTFESFTIPITIASGSARTLYLPEATVSIEAEAFAETDFNTVFLTSPNLVTLMERAFADCKTLRSVYIAPGVVNIADNAFFGCDDITIYGAKGSAAEAFALKEGMKFIAYDFDD